MDADDTVALTDCKERHNLCFEIGICIQCCPFKPDTVNSDVDTFKSCVIRTRQDDSKNVSKNFRLRHTSRSHRVHVLLVVVLRGGAARRRAHDRWQRGARSGRRRRREGRRRREHRLHRLTRHCLQDLNVTHQRIYTVRYNQHTSLPFGSDAGNVPVAEEVPDSAE